ncbi:hypothetical protein CASFOL_017800 [Castilleja foliolosa]|uniref:SKP1 component dimerisation domain-containing protein n=1 Tax=Castilleja foliolosa TaxID=1961234 RepID=A0ABD3D991_9LAMI
MGQECKHWCISDDNPSSTPVSLFGLNITSLLDLTTHAVADMIQGKTPEEVRKVRC